MSGICSIHRDTRDPNCKLCNWAYEDPVKEPRDGSPLKSVVQGREESHVPSNPTVQGTPDILAELRARVMHGIEKCKNLRATEEFKYGYTEEVLVLGAEIDTLNTFLRWLDELAPPNDNTAPDTTSGSAGVP